MNEPAAETTGEPLPWELADQLVAAQVEAQLLGAAAHPMTLGRYRVERALGEGAMGQLLLGFDPDLRRQVALKLITPARAGSAEARRRIVREAQAMARLSDPHVAQVYEVGQAQGQLYVAIEYVDGQDLRHWMNDGPRPWSRVLEVFGQAGAGLAAAHEQGITHRDFKPENVMLERDGRARVIDFGLALPGEGHEGVVAEGVGLDGGPAEMTRTGTVLGTPAYLAPELWEGAVADPRSDQFAFCVALYEAIAGERPFTGKTLVDLQDALHRGPPSRLRGGPVWVSRALRRGLASDPAQRWPDMRALLRALDPARRRRRRGAVVFAGLLAGALGLAARPAEDPCREAGAQLDEDWGPDRHEVVAAWGRQADPTWGERSAAALVERLDAQAQAWREASRAVCAGARAGDVDRTAGPACLQRVRGQLVGAVAEAEQADPALWVSAVARAELWLDPGACVEATGAPRAAPDDLRANMEQVEQSLGVMSVRAGATSFVEATATARRAVTEAVAAAEAASDEARLARALWLDGRVHLGQGENKLAERSLRRARAVAERVGDESLVAAVTAELVYAVARDRERFGEAEDLATEAESMIAALGSPALLEARLWAHRASALAHAPTADRDQAVRLHEQVVGRLEQTLGPEHPMTIVARGNLGSALNYAGRPAQAQARLVEAIEQAEAVWGSDHPRTGVLWGTLGFSRMRQKDLARAEADLRRSYEIREATLGPDHAQVDDARYNLAVVLRRRDRHAEALPLLEAGLAHTLARLGPDDARLGAWWTATGESALALGRHARAREALASALRVFERTGASAPDYARVRLGLARSVVESDPSLARAWAQQALADATAAKAEARRTEIEALLATLP